MLLFNILALSCFFIHPPFLVYWLIPMFLLIFIPRCFLKIIFGLFTYFQISIKSSYSHVSIINCEKQSSRESAADNRSPQYMEISQHFSSTTNSVQSKSSEEGIFLSLTWKVQIDKRTHSFYWFVSGCKTFNYTNNLVYFVCCNFKDFVFNLSFQSSWWIKYIRFYFR